MASHDNLRFSAVRLSTQTHKPDGPIQQFELCLHDDWQSTPNSIRIHLLSSNADALLATTGGSGPSGSAIALPIRVEEDDRYMVVDTHDDDESDQEEPENFATSWRAQAQAQAQAQAKAQPQEDNETSWHERGENPKGWPRPRPPVDTPDKDRLTSPEVANFIVSAGLIRLYHDPYESHEASPQPPPASTTTSRRPTVVDGLIYLMCFACGAIVAWIVLLVVADTEREEVFIDAANRTININLNYVSVRRAILLGNEALLNNPIEYGVLLFNETINKSWHSSLSTTRRHPRPDRPDLPDHAPVYPLFVLNSAGDFVPEFYFFQDLLVVLGHMREDFVTLSGSHQKPTDEFDSFLDRAELTVYELQRLHAAAENDLTLAWGPRSVESINHCFKRLASTLPYDDDEMDGFGHANRWTTRLRDRWIQDPRVIRLRNRWDHDPLVNHLRRRWSREPPPTNATMEKLRSVFTNQPFPGIFSPATGSGGSHGATPEHLIAHLARKLSTTLLHMHRIMEHAENATADVTVPIDDETLTLTYDDDDDKSFAAARVHSTARFLREIALPRLRRLEENVRAGLGLLRNVLLAQHEMASYLSETSRAGAQGVVYRYPETQVMINGVEKAREWIMGREVSGVDAEFRALQAPFHSARRTAIETSNAVSLPPDLIYSRQGLRDNRSDPYGAERLIWEAPRSSSKRDADTMEEEGNDVTSRKRSRLWFWKIH